jgi:hypothetical protein
VTLRDEPYVKPLPPDARARTGQLMRVFGIVTLRDGVPYLASDSVEFIPADSWAHIRGTVRSVDNVARRITIQTESGETKSLQLTETSYISLPDGTRANLADVAVGALADATGQPRADSTLIVQELFVAR